MVMGAVRTVRTRSTPKDKSASMWHTADINGSAAEQWQQNSKNDHNDKNPNDYEPSSSSQLFAIVAAVGKQVAGKDAFNPK